MARIDHVIDTRAEEIIGGRASKHRKNSQKSNGTAYQAGRYCIPGKLKI
jgi:hypothetical protein